MNPKPKNHRPRNHPNQTPIPQTSDPRPKNHEPPKPPNPGPIPRNRDREPSLSSQVRRTLSFSMHELAMILGPETTATSLLPAMDTFLKDLDEVKIGVLQVLKRAPILRFGTSSSPSARDANISKSFSRRSPNPQCSNLNPKPKSFSQRSPNPQFSTISESLLPRSK